MKRITRAIVFSVLLFTPESFAATQFHVPNSVVYAILGVDLNAVGAAKDNQIHFRLGKYIARRITVTNASTSLASSPATLCLYTAANAGGTNIVPCSTLTSLNTNQKFGELTFTFASYSTLPTVFLRNGTAHGSAATVDVYVEVTPLL